jgi:histidyl-tRNA synthetase
MNDILPDEVGRWHRLEAVFRNHASLHGYDEVRTPLIEPTQLFTRQVGETTDIVEKEMYSFERHGDQLTVRPEGTASAARAYVEHRVANKEPVSRWYYLGAMFRGERPAKGRYRQFYQAGCELYGEAGPIADAEMISFCVTLFERLGIGGLMVHVNSLGSGDTRHRYREALLEYFRPLAAGLSEDSQRRLEKNPLRILDSKDARDIEAAKGAPKLHDLLDDADRAHWDGLKRLLTAASIPFVEDPQLVRGLDYYTRTLFEVKTSAGDLGSQNTIAGGGRYDGMIESLGGPKVPAIGFAMGLERVLIAMPTTADEKPARVMFAPMNDDGAAVAIRIAREARALGVACEIDGRGSKVKAMLRRADAIAARACVLLGDEVGRGVVSIKDLASHTQAEVPIAEAAKYLAGLVSAGSAR